MIKCLPVYFSGYGIVDNIAGLNSFILRAQPGINPEGFYYYRIALWFFGHIPGAVSLILSYRDNPGVFIVIAT